MMSSPLQWISRRVSGRGNTWNSSRFELQIQCISCTFREENGIMPHFSLYHSLSFLRKGSYVEVFQNQYFFRRRSGIIIGSSNKRFNIDGISHENTNWNSRHSCNPRHYSSLREGSLTSKLESPSVEKIDIELAPIFDSNIINALDSFLKKKLQSYFKEDTFDSQDTDFDIEPFISKLSEKKRRRFIREFIASSPLEWQYWSPNLVKAIAKRLNLDETQVRRSTVIGRIEKRFGRPSSVIEDHDLEFLRMWIEDKESKLTPLDAESPLRNRLTLRDISHSEKMFLLQKLSCSKQQLLDSWKRCIQKPGIVDDISKEKVRNWFLETGRNPRNLTSSDRDELQILTGWSRMQLNRQLQLLRQGENRPITAKAKRILKNWLEANGNRVPSTRERDELEVESGLARRQVDSILAHLRQSQGSVSAQMRIYISEWLKGNGFKRPDRREREELLRATKLASWQLTSLISQILLSRTAGTVNEESKEIVKNWVLKNPQRRPSHSEREELLSKTGWNTKQLSNAIRNFKKRQKPDQGTQDFKPFVKNDRNQMERPKPEETGKKI